MVESAGGIEIDIKVKNAKAISNVSKLQDRLRGLTKDARRSANDMAKWGAGVAAAATVAGSAIIQQSLSASVELTAMAQAANTTAAALQQQAFATQQVGVSQEKYADILKDVNDKVGDFLTTGGGPMLDFFEQIAPKVGVTADQFRNLSGPQALQLYVDSLEKANLSQSEMTFFMEAIANDSTRLLPLLQNNGRAMQEQADAARELGIGLSEIDLAVMAEANAEIQKVVSVLKNDASQAAATLSPIIAEMAGEFLDARQSMGDLEERIVNGARIAVKGFGVMANGIHGIEVGLKGAEFVGRAFIAAIVGGSVKIIELMSTLQNAIIEGTFTPLTKTLELLAPFSDQAQDALNNVRGIADSLKTEVPDGFRQFADAQFAALEETGREFDKLALKELPSEKFNKFFENAVIKAKEARARIESEIQNTTPGQQEEGEAPEFQRVDPADAKKLQQETEALLENLEIRYLSEEELLLNKLAREQAIIDQALDAKIISEKEASDAIMKIRSEEEKAKFAIAAKGFQQLLGALSGNSKKMQKIVSAGAKLNAIVKGKEAAVEAWAAGMSVGGPFAPLTAAAYAAASIAKTAGIIRSMKGPGSGSIGGGSGGAPSVPTRAAPQAAPQAQEPQRVFNIAIEGQGPVGPDQIRSLISEINEAVGDGVELRTS